MKDLIDSTLGWWIAVVELPVLSALFWMIWNNRRDNERGMHHLEEDLAEHKLYVARNYARTHDMHELEGRLTSHLLRIEAKLDVTALKAEALQAERK